MEIAALLTKALGDAVQHNLIRQCMGLAAARPPVELLLPLQADLTTIDLHARQAAFKPGLL